jgi:hypothetical protein
MSTKIFECSPKFSLYECCHYSRSDIRRTMFSSHRINPNAVYRMLCILH